MPEIRSEDIDIDRNKEKNRFEADLDGDKAVAEYTLHDGLIDLTFVGVPDKYRGRGLGDKLARTALDFAREEGLAVRPSCPFVKSFIDEHPEYQDLVVS